MFDKDNKFGFIVNNNESNNIKNTDLPCTVSSKVLATVPASDIKIDDNIIINNVSINKDRRYYIEFLGSKKLCNLVISEEQGNCIMCSIGNYGIQAFNVSTNILVRINKINTDDTTTDTFTDLVIYEEEIKCLDNKYLETDLVLQNSIGIGRIGDIGMGSSAIGSAVTASGDGSHAEGTHTTATGMGSHAEGGSTISSGVVSHAEGDNTTASGDYGSHAEGSSTKATGMGSHAEGSMAISSGLYSHAEGNGTTASGSVSHAEGDSTKAIGICSHVEGDTTIASGDYQHVQGKYNIEDTASKYAHIVGNGDDGDNRSNAHTLDWEGNAWYKGQVEGTNLPYTVSSKKLTTVLASNIKIDEPITINNTSINKDRRYYIEFLGSKKLCSLLISEEQGNCIICNIDGYIIEAFNQSTNISLIIINTNTHDTTIFTDLVIYEEEIKCLDNKYLENNLIIQNSISLGRIGDIGGGSSAIGAGVEASAICSHAEGNLTKALGRASHVEGNLTIASGEISHAEGDGTIASSQYQHVQGKYNIEDTEDKYAHIVGNGTDEDARSNAHTLDWQGNAWYAGKLSQEGTPTEDKDLTTKKYVDDSRDYYFKTPTILYDDPNLPKGYVDITTLEKGTNYRVNSSIVSGFFKVSLKAPNDDGTWFTVDDGSNTIGWSSMLSTSICIQLKSDTFIAINMNCINNYCKYLSITKENGKWKLMQTKLDSISPDNTYKYDVTDDYNPAHKKYVDDKVSSLPQFSFNENGELVVKIGDTTKIFVPKE